MPDSSSSEIMFFSPTLGRLSMSSLIREVINYIQELPEYRYTLIIGTDSKKYNSGSVYVSIIMLHRLGRGGRYFWTKSIDLIDLPMRQRVIKEAFCSINLAKDFLGALNNEIIRLKIPSLKIEIHVDIGFKGATKDIVREIVSMIEANGFKAYIKPYSYGASFVADRYT